MIGGHIKAVKTTFQKQDAIKMMTDRFMIQQGMRKEMAEEFAQTDLEIVE